MPDCVDQYERLLLTYDDCNREYCVHRGRRLSAATLTSFVYAILFAEVPIPAHSDWSLGGNAYVRYDDNVGNAEYARDIVSDSIVGATLSIFQSYPIGESCSLTAGAELGGEHYDRLDGLSNASVGGTLALKKKWGLGAFVPWARIEFSLARTDFSDDYRNASIYRGTLAMGRRIDERWNLWAEYAFERRNAAGQPEEVPGVSGDAYSQNSHNLVANAQYSLSESTFLTFGLLLRHGDIVSTTQENSKIYTAPQAIAEDPAFGPDAYAYRLIGTTVGVKAGINYSPTPHSLIELFFQRLDTHAGGNDYTKSMPQITWDYLF